MATTACIKCHTLPSFDDSNSKVVFGFEVVELCKKFRNYLDENRIDYLKEDSLTVILKSVCLVDFLSTLLSKSIFKKHEREAICILSLNENEDFHYSKIRDVKSLEKYKNLISASELSNLLTKGGLTAHFQPILDIENNTIYGYETLARGVNDDGTLVYPDKLFKWAKDGDMLFYLDRACRESSLKTAAIKNIRAKVFINFIPTAIYDPNHCLQSTVKWANSLEFDPKNVIFEVVESENVEDIEHLKNILNFYKSKGFMIALDDVGSGYSSLNMIVQLHPDIVKIDREIIKDIDKNKANQSVFGAIVKIAKDNNIIVLAEGIETKEEFLYLKENGASLAQGYYFAKPSSEPIRKINF
ncbi:EAL domain-containing protein [Aliarcobacter cibarius]|uniref:EAL domain-containing protein n=1 Tax=Aliarcobacter cibarius TaxID=255507 RepID=A0ABY2V4U1_9BACT|nr:EAL domain-containing protein [Aliarcobacter cibarius]TLS98851.1 EAL domain-containing protein [Aliarcobacter cibarius]TLS99646.1 EAL domain-containing protein [Aliarcobacter cibarius]